MPAVKPVETAILPVTDTNERDELARNWVNSQANIAAFISSLVWDFHEAEELLQETAVQVFRNADRFDAAQPFLPWTMAIARHVVLRHQRTAARDRHVFDNETVAEIATAVQDVAEGRELMRRQLQICLKRLSARSNELCRLRYEEGLSPPAIALRVGKTAGSVSTMLSRIRDQLRECLEQRLRSQGVVP